MHLALVQPLNRARKSGEVCELPLTAQYRAVGDGDIGRPVQLGRPFAPRKGLHF